MTTPPDETNEEVSEVGAADEGPQERLIILSGMSGAGKTTALHALEDVGFFAVDNVPPSLWTPLALHARRHGKDRLVVSVDVRTAPFLPEVEEGLAGLEEHGFHPSVLFLTASEPVLVRRYNFTRRTHPLGEGTLSADLASERRTLEVLRRHAERVIDTTELGAKDLALRLQRIFAGPRSFRLRLVSFGFKRGAPIDADLVLDVRSLPNPFYEETLRPLPGTDASVQAHVFSPSGLELYTQLRSLTRNLAGLANETGRHAYTVALGCTGGQHRSVAVVERLAHDLADEFEAHVEHRDLEAALQEKHG